MDTFVNALNTMSGEVLEGCFTVTDTKTGKVLFTDYKNLMATALTKGFTAIRNQFVVQAYEQGLYNAVTEEVRFTFRDKIKDYRIAEYLPYGVDMNRSTFRTLPFSNLAEYFFSRDLGVSDDILLLGSTMYADEVRCRRGMETLLYERYEGNDDNAKMQITINESSTLADMNTSISCESFEISCIEEFGESGIDDEVVKGGKCEMKFKDKVYKFEFKDSDEFIKHYYKGIELIALPYYKSLG